MSLFGIDIQKEAVAILEPGILKHDALNRMVEALTAAGAVEAKDQEALARAVHEREAVMSTGIGSGVAIPHVRIEQVKKPMLGVGISKKGLDFNTLDNEPVHIIVLFAMPSGSQREYLAFLAQVMRALKMETFQDRLIECNTPEEVAAVINEG